MIEQEKLKEILLRDLEIGDLPAKAQEEILANLGESIMKKIMLAIFDNLPEAARAEFEVLAKNGDPAKLQIFLKSQIAGIDALIQNTIQGVIRRYKELAGGQK